MAIFDKKNAIKIEEDDLNDAKLSSIDFDDLSVKKRAFINVLGARIAMKMLFSKKIEANNVYSLYTIHNILEDLDIADIYVGDIKIDVRLVFNKDEIFIPKKHFEYNILPDLYIVMQLKEDFSCIEPLGFFEPKDLDKTNYNSDFYFHEYENLNGIKDIKTFLKSYTTNTNPDISEEDIEKSETLFLSLVDKEISEEDKLFLCQQLTNSIALREKLVEFENFELIAKETSKNENLLQDGVLDIVGAQQVSEDESANATQAEVKAEVIGEVLSDLILDENKITDIEEEEVPTRNSEEDEDFINELLSTTTDEKEDKKEDKKVNTDLITGIAIGGAIAGGVAAANTITDTSVAKAGLDAVSAGIDLADNIIEKSLDAASSAFESAEDFLESLSEKEQEISKEIEQQTQEFEDIEEKKDEEIFDLDELDFQSIEDSLQAEDSQYENIETLPNEEIEAEEKPEIENLEQIDDSQNEATDLTQYNETEENNLKEEQEIELSIEDSNIGFENLEELPELEKISESEKIEQLAPDNLESIQDIEQFSSDFNETELKEISPLEALPELNSLPALDEFEEEPVSNLNDFSQLEQNITDENFAETSIEQNEILEENVLNPEESNFEDIKDNSELNGIISSMPDIDGLISSGEFNFEDLKEKVDEVLFEDKPNFEAYGINEEDLKKSVEKSNIEEEETTENLEPPTEFDKNLLDNSENKFDDIPNLNIESSSTKEEEPAQEESNEPNKSVFNLDDFDFNLLNDGAESDFKELDEAAKEADDLKKKILDEDFDYESIERQLEEEEEKEKSANQAPVETESEFDDNDDFLSQVDDFINDIDNSEGNLELSEIDKNLLENTINSFNQDEIFDTSSLITNTTDYSEQTKSDFEDETEDDEEDETLQLLFKNKGIKADGDAKDREILPSIHKDKKMVVAASIASVVLVSAVIGVGIINSNKANNLNNLATKPAAVQNISPNMSQDMSTQNADMNADLSQQVPDLNGQGQQNVLPGSPQQMDPNRDMGQAVSDAFTSEPINATISKIAWEVPEDLAYNDGFRSYLQIAGKNLKLNLQNSLLLATEMAYSNKVVVNLVINGDGSILSSSIVTSSGSKQIDKIVLQSVKETLMYLKMPSSELRGKTVNATLIINF